MCRLRIGNIYVKTNVENLITNFVYHQKRQSTYMFNTYELKFNRMNANTATAFLKFERCADYIEFIQLMDQQVFLGLKLKVMPFGLTNLDRQSLSKPQLWQDSACKLFNTQWYPKDETSSTSAINKSNKQVLESADFIPLKTTSNSVKRKMSSFSINGNDNKKTCLSGDEEDKTVKEEDKGSKKKIKVRKQTIYSQN